MTAPVDVLAVMELDKVARAAEADAQERAYLLRVGGSPARIAELTQQIIDSAMWTEGYARAALARVQGGAA